MKRIVQFALLIIIIVLIYLFYAIYFKVDKEVKVTKKILSDTELNQNNNDSIQNLEYEINIDEKNYYKIISESSEIVNDRNIELLKMQNVEGIFINNNSQILITSDNAIYNILTHKTNFKENVKIKYFDRIGAVLLQ
jgi:L-cystine uptake protein TcyP (sodium:dicarboxylate symporter family)